MFERLRPGGLRSAPSLFSIFLKHFRPMTCLKIKCVTCAEKEFGIKKLVKYGTSHLFCTP